MAMPVDRLATIRIPTLVLDGGASPPWIRSSATALAAAIPDARHVSLDGQTHGAAPEVLVPVLIDFFS
jgi:pimeloyl-ACP methyl ester carboxylesterase